MRKNGEGRLFKVLVEQTGVETVVSEKYYEKYKGDGIRFLEEHKRPVKATKKSTTAIKVED